MSRAEAALAASGLLMACATNRSHPAIASPRCNAARLQARIGRPGTAALVEALRRASGAALSRTLTPSAMVPMDYREDRLNVTLSKSGTVAAIRCG